MTPESSFLANHERHVALVRHFLRVIGRDLEARAETHDLSKLDPAGELPGYIRLAQAASEWPYGSPGYKAAIDAERPTVEAHYATNSHHPQFHEDLGDMGWLDIIEMVADWRSASKTRGGSWPESVRIGLESHPWSDAQRWLIQEVAGFLA